MVGKMHGMETQWVFKESSVSFHILSIHNTFYHFSTMLMGWSQVPVFSQQPGLFTGDTYFQRSTCQCRRWRRLRFDPWVGKILWRRKRQPTPVFLPGKSHGQSSLVGYRPWGRNELDTTWLLNNNNKKKLPVSPPWIEGWHVGSENLLRWSVASACLWIQVHGTGQLILLATGEQVDSTIKWKRKC